MYKQNQIIVGKKIVWKVQQANFVVFFEFTNHLNEKAIQKIRNSLIEIMKYIIDNWETSSQNIRWHLIKNYSFFCVENQLGDLLKKKVGYDEMKECWLIVQRLKSSPTFIKIQVVHFGYFGKGNDSSFYNNLIQSQKVRKKIEQDQIKEKEFKKKKIEVYQQKKKLAKLFQSQKSKEQNFPSLS